MSFYFIFPFLLLVTNWYLEDSRVSGRRPSVFRFYSFIRFHSFLPFDAIRPARQRRLPGVLQSGLVFQDFQYPPPPPPLKTSGGGGAGRPAAGEN